MLFIYFWLPWLFVTTLFSSCGGKGLLSGNGTRASLCSGFSCCRAQALGCVGFSSWGSQALKHRLKSYCMWASLLHGIRGLPRSGIEPVSPALAGGFFTTESPGKLLHSLLSPWWKLTVRCLLLYSYASFFFFFFFFLVSKEILLS